MLKQPCFEDMMRSEKEVAEYLTNLNIVWEFERPVFVYDDKGRPRVWTPDFYLPQLGIYIEVCGNEKFNYEYREKVYKSNGIFTVFIHWYKDKNKWKKFLGKRLQEIEKYRKNKVNAISDASLSEKKVEYKQVEKDYCPYCGCDVYLEGRNINMCALCEEMW